MSDKKLFTPGPLNCSLTTKEAMLRDLGSRDSEFIQTVRDIQTELLNIAGVSPKEWTAVLMQGSGTFAVEAVLQTGNSRVGARVLVLANGKYGQRMAKICEVVGIPCDLQESSEVLPVRVEDVRETLSKKHYSMVCLVHCETSSGVMNDVEAVGSMVRELQPSARFFVDAMSSFGAVPLCLAEVDFMVSSANKCLQGVPGFSFSLCRRSVLSSCKGNSRSHSLDLEDQDSNITKTGQFRFTPPTHVMLAFRQAIREYYSEGGLQGRMARYQNNRAFLKSGMGQLGFTELVPEQHAGHIITCFHYPHHENFNFEIFYKSLSDKGLVIYPGKLTDATCFRIGNIGNLVESDMCDLLVAIREVLQDMGIPAPLA